LTAAAFPLRQRLVKRILLGLLLVLPSLSFAWDPVGHMLVAQIAYDRLSPSVKTKADANIKAFNDAHHTAYTFVTAACWMDDARAQTKEYNTWHYITLPYNAEGTPLPASSEQNVLWATHLCLDIIAGKATYPGIDKDQAMVMLEHLEGDSHQPLHATDHGDMGGNKTNVTNLKDAQSDLLFSKGGNLHFFWDSAYRRVFQDGFAAVAYEAPLYAREQPVSGHNAALTLVKQEADALLKKYPAESVTPTNTPEDWIHESHRLGYSLAYAQLPGGDMTPSTALDQAYVDKARDCADKRIVEAGCRLANLLNSIY